MDLTQAHSTQRSTHSTRSTRNINRVLNHKHGLTERGYSIGEEATRPNERINERTNVTLTNLHIVTDAISIFFHVRNGDGDRFGELRESRN